MIWGWWLIDLWTEGGQRGVVPFNCLLEPGGTCTKAETHRYWSRRVWVLADVLMRAHEVPGRMWLICCGWIKVSDACGKKKEKKFGGRVRGGCSRMRLASIGQGSLTRLFGPIFPSSTSSVSREEEVQTKPDFTHFLGLKRIPEERGMNWVPKCIFSWNN